MRKNFPTGENDVGRRLDAVLRRFLPTVSLSVLQRAIREGDIRIGGKKTTSDYRIAALDVVSIWERLLPEVRAPLAGPVMTARQPDWVLFQSEDFFVVNKRSGELVQGDHTGDVALDERVREVLLPKLTPSLGFRPGPLHRLDRPTSGIVVFSASLKGAQAFSAVLAAGETTKTYWALLQGRLTGEHRVDSALERDEETLTTQLAADGKPAVSVFRPLWSGTMVTLVEVLIETGRTHQIRAHAASMGFPLAGDSKYGGTKGPSAAPRPWFLHAQRLECSLFPALEAPVDQATVNFLQKTYQVFLPGVDQ